MKNLVLTALLIASPAMAGEHYHEHYHHHEGGHFGGIWSLAIPAAIGGIVIYEATRPTIVEPQSIIVQPTFVSPPGISFYCPINRQYYPATPTCDQPWLKVTQ